MRKIVFIINTIPNQRCIKRINEFIENGYDIDAYSFVREGSPFRQSEKFKIETIGEFKKSGGYKNRIKIIINAVLAIRRKYKYNPNVIYYYFGLDIAIFYTFFIKSKYIYEESDLSQTYLGNSFFKNILNLIDKKIIKNSVETILTSEGFLKYHYGGITPENVSVIPNRINKECLNLELKSKKEINLQKLKIGFVGLIRYNSIINFAKVLTEQFPNNEFHFFGKPINDETDLSNLKTKSNVFFHGEFQNPVELPALYSSIDLVLSTYDVNVENVKYAEPNKIYEAIFFQTPIIVSKDTFLSEKVEKLGIGYSIDAMNNTEIIEFVKSLSEKDIKLKIKQCKQLPLSFSVDNNKDFFIKISSKIP